METRDAAEAQLADANITAGILSQDNAWWTTDGSIGRRRSPSIQSPKDPFVPPRLRRSSMWCQGRTQTWTKGCGPDEYGEVVPKEKQMPEGYRRNSGDVVRMLGPSKLPLDNPKSCRPEVKRV